VSLVARHLEAQGLPTLCMASARDIISAGRVPRALFIDYPLGHTCGKPGDGVDQLAIVRAALRALASAHQPETIIDLPHTWGDDAWRDEASSAQAEDTRQPRDESPQFQFAADREAARASGALI
jgi:hypothetical protein